MSESVTWADLQDEYERNVIGDLWLDEVSTAVRNVAPKYPPNSYTETGRWDAHEYENLVQDVVVNHLLGDGQLAYIVATATDRSVARALIHRTVRRCLARGRRRTIVDNLLDRCRAIDALDSAIFGGNAATDAQLRAAATRVARLPRIRIINSDRAPAVFSEPTLRSTLDIAHEVLGPNLRERDVARIFELALTDFVPSGLVTNEGGMDEPDRALTPEEEVTVMDTLRHLTARPAPELQLLAMKIANASDNAVADHFGVSRPTAAKRFRDASTAVEQALDGLPPQLQDEVLVRLSDRLLHDHLPVNDNQGGDE